MITKAVYDFRDCLRKSYLVKALGWQDIATRYRRSRVGVFWLTVNMMVLIIALGLVFGALFGLPLRSFLPYVAIGIIFWNFFVLVLTESCVAFTGSDSMILQVKMPLSTHILRVYWRNLIITSHHAILLPVLFLLLGLNIEWSNLLVLPGFAIVTLNLLWMSIILAIVSTRFRDISQIVVNALQVAFYLTPVIWLTSYMPEKFDLRLLQLNPFYHFLELTRAPLLGHHPEATSWIVCLVTAIVGWPLALWMFARYRDRIPYWL